MATFVLYDQPSVCVRVSAGVAQSIENFDDARIHFLVNCASRQPDTTDVQGTFAFPVRDGVILIFCYSSSQAPIGGRREIMLASCFEIKVASRDWWGKFRRYIKSIPYGLQLWNFATRIFEWARDFWPF